MQACAACGKEVDGSDLFMSAKGEVCAECNLDDEIQSRGMMLGSLTIVALIAAVLPFFLTVWVTSGGQTISYIAVGGGGVAVLVGAAAIATAPKSGKARSRNLMASLAAVVLGAFHLLRGFGVI
jgi:hypothetical protein